MVQNGTLGSYAKSVINPGESFLFMNGEWQDWSLAATFSVRNAAAPDSGGSGGGKGSGVPKTGDPAALVCLLLSAAAGCSILAMGANAGRKAKR